MLYVEDGVHFLIFILFNVSLNVKRKTSQNVWVSCEVIELHRHVNIRGYGSVILEVEIILIVFDIVLLESYDCLITIRMIFLVLGVLVDVSITIFLLIDDVEEHLYLPSIVEVSDVMVVVTYESFSLRMDNGVVVDYWTIGSSMLIFVNRRRWITIAVLSIVV